MQKLYTLSKLVSLPEVKTPTQGLARHIIIEACLICEHEGLSSNLQQPSNKMGMAAHDCNPSHAQVGSKNSPDEMEGFQVS